MFESWISVTTPTPSEEQLVAKAAENIVTKINAELVAGGVDAVASVQGSVAKQTWLPGLKDLDVFVAFSETIPASEMEMEIEKIAQKILANPRSRYAQHPYRVGEFEGFQVDLVPCLKISNATKLHTAVDRTPLHTKWVNGKLTTAQKQDVRVAKQFLKRIEAYGAESFISGYSGYLVEVLIHHFGSFENWVKNQASAKPHLFVPPTFAGGAEGDFLRVQDPVDVNRNVASAVSKETFERFSRACNILLENPHAIPATRPARKIELRPLQIADADWNCRECSKVDCGVYGRLVRVDFVDGEMELAAAQLQRFFESLRTHLRKFGFDGARLKCFKVDEKFFALYHWEATHQAASFQRFGPSLSKPENIAIFKRKWENNPLTKSLFEKDGFLMIEQLRENRTLHEEIAFYLRSERAEIVQKKYEFNHQVTLSDLPPAALRTATNFIDNREVWE